MSGVGVRPTGRDRRPLIDAVLTRFLFRSTYLERLVIYIVFSDLAAKAVFELALGRPFLLTPHYRQFIFFFLLFIDCCFNMSSFIRLRINSISSLLFISFIFTMIGHGVIVGLLNHNRPFEIFSDTVPLIVIAANIFIVQAEHASGRRSSLPYLLAVTTLLMLLVVAVGEAAVALGNPSKVGGTASGQTVYICLFLAAIGWYRKIPARYGVSFLVIAAVTLYDINRTVMVCTALCALPYFLKHFRRNLLSIVLAGTVLSAGLYVAYLTLPEDSRTVRRVTGLWTLDLSERRGSIGEREAEEEAIDAKLRRMGATSGLFGAGHGALYNVKFTHQYMVDYGNAHFGWAWFRLRYGDVGYVYLVLMLLCSVWAVLCNWRGRSAMSMFIVMLNVYCIVYFITYVNFVILLAGLQFYLDRNGTPSPNPGPRPAGIRPPAWAGREGRGSPAE